MSRVRNNTWLNITAFFLPFLAGYIALTTDAFLFLALFCVAALASLFHSSAQIKTAARFSLLGFISGFVAVFLILINSDLG
jgi:hypothetical protein